MLPIENPNVMPINSSTTLIVTTCPIWGLFYSYNNISMSNFWTMSMWFALWLTNHTYQWLNPQMYHNFFSISYALKKPSKFVAIIAHWNNIFFIPIFKNFLIAWGWAKLIITRRRTTTKTWRRHPLCWGENGKEKTLEIVPSYIILLIIFALILHLTLYIAYI